MDIQQRAKRAVARKNNKLAKKYPLFASQFAFTVDDQIERLQKMDVSTDKHFEKMFEAERARYEKAMMYRDVCAANMTAEKFAELDARAYRIYGTRGKFSQPEYSGSYYADWWWQCIREFVPSYAQAHCPNVQFHDWEIYQAEGECPTCKTRLTKRTPDVEDSAIQLSFIQPQALSAPQAYPRRPHAGNANRYLLPPGPKSRLEND